MSASQSAAANSTGVREEAGAAAALRTTATILLSLFLWLLIYRLVHLIVYGVAKDHLPNFAGSLPTWLDGTPRLKDVVSSVLAALDWLLGALLGRPGTAPAQRSTFLDFIFLLGSFSAAVVVAMKATRKKQAALLPSAQQSQGQQKPATTAPAADAASLVARQ